jgi:hypothetical protein
MMMASGVFGENDGGSRVAHVAAPSDISVNELL